MAAPIPDNAYGGAGEESQRGPRSTRGWKGQGRGIRQPGIAKGTPKHPTRRAARS